METQVIKEEIKKSYGAIAKNEIQWLKTMKISRVMKKPQTWL